MQQGAANWWNWALVVWRWLRSHGYHLLFGFTLILLATLILWWSVFIRQAIEQQRAYHYDSVRDTAQLLALTIGHNRAEEPQLGEIALDTRLEIVECTGADHSMHDQFPF